MKSPSLGLSAPWCAALSAHRPFSFLHIGLQIGDFIHFSSCHPGGGSGIFLFILENKSAFGKKKISGVESWRILQGSPWPHFWSTRPHLSGHLCGARAESQAEGL